VWNDAGEALHAVTAVQFGSPGEVIARALTHARPRGAAIVAGKWASAWIDQFHLEPGNQDPKDLLAKRNGA
jgi:hypothetical protein